MVIEKDVNSIYTKKFSCEYLGKVSSLAIQRRAGGFLITFKSVTGKMSFEAMNNRLLIVSIIVSMTIYFVLIK